MEQKSFELRSFVDFFKQKYGSRLQKVVIDGGFSCPNRDGEKGYGGCTFCLNDAFHPNYATPDRDIHYQIDEGIKFHKVRYRKAQKYIAYFQSYSNTYAPLERLKELYSRALEHPQIEGLVIGTRPDCVDEAKLDYLTQLSKNKVIIIEYGIESCYNKTLERINRGHTFEQARVAVEATAARGITQCAHFIFGLPGESLQMMADEAQIINSLPVTAVKFHQLQIIKGTAMEREFAERKEDFHHFTLNGYLDFIAEFIKRLRSDIYIDRFASEVPPRYLSELQESWGLVRYQELVKMLKERL